MVGALGVVFGDIGTSPLYAVQTVFAIDDGAVKPTPEDVYGVISLIFWAIVVIVSVKYVTFILRADNEGEGGVLSLAHLTRQSVRPGGKRFRLVMILGVIGASLFYGDSLITPAISVMSAVEGLQVVDPALKELVLPIGVTILTILFAGQRFGTETVGKLFGPIMLLWFVVIGLLGIPHIVADPHVLSALLPTHAVGFFVAHPFIAFIAMGAAVLAITGAEALYADMGHFGRPPITRAWFFVVFPALTLNYLGQAQLVLHSPQESVNPFFHLAPDWAQLPLVALATAATVIASQAVISGAFSVSRQAERLGYLPRLTVRQTSDVSGGQIYVPVVNWLLFAGVITLLLTFRASERLATAYGLAVTATLLLTTALFCVYAQAALGWGRARLAAIILGFGVLEFAFFAANLTKVIHGGWLPLLIATTIGTVMLTWRRGTTLVTARRTMLEGPMTDFIDELHDTHVRYVPGLAVFLHPNKDTVPLALRENFTVNRVMHKDVLVVSTVSTNVPYVPDSERVVFDDLGDPNDHFEHITLRFGYLDEQDVPRGLQIAKDQGIPLDLDNAYYFLSRITIHRSDRPGIPQWRKRLFITMAHNAANPTDYFKLPIGRTVIMGAQVRF
jgi:KUP system potassium uptake protein